MVARHHARQHHKVQLRWQGPCEIQVIIVESKFVCRVRLLDTNKLTLTHVQRMYRFTASSFTVPPKLIEIKPSDTIQFTVENFIDFRIVNESIELQVSTLIRF